jgi:hypothetical protein
MPRSWMPRRIAWPSNLHPTQGASSRRQPSRPRRSGEPALSEVEGDLLVLCCPSDLTVPNKSHHPPLVIPSAAEGPAVHPAPAQRSPFVLPQNRHPERSASQIDRLTLRLWRAVEGPRRCLFHPCCSELFGHRSPTTTKVLSFRPHHRFRNTLRTLHHHPILGFQSSPGRNPTVSRDIE